jgi:arsenical pump membrane protein
LPDWAALVLSLVGLAATLATAAARPPGLGESAVAVGSAALLVAVGAISLSGAWRAVGELGPTIGFLAALLVLADGCRREGVFDAIGAWMARASAGRSVRLLGLTFAAATAVTTVLGLDATVVLLTPVAFVTAMRLRTPVKPHAYACAHLANSASVLLVVSNLTNLLAFHASRLSFTRFAALMALPWAAAIAVEWVAFRAFFRRELATHPEPALRLEGRAPTPRFALGVLTLTLLGFALSSEVGFAPVWSALAGAAAITLPALTRRRAVAAVVRAAEPGFLLFVLGLGVIVAAASAHGVRSAVASALPVGGSLPDLLGVAGVSALLANLVNNLPATLILTPVTAALGTAPVLAMLVGVNVGPNLTYAGSLATLLWRRVLRVERTEVLLAEFTRLGLMTVPAGLLLCTLAVWVSVRGWG